MKITKQRMKKAVKVSAVPAGLLASGLLVLGYSNAAFNAHTENASNSWGTDTVALSDNDTGSKPLFSTSVANMSGAIDQKLTPGSTLVDRSIDVTYTSSNPSDVTLTATPGVDGGIAQYVKVKVTDEASATVFDGTLQQLASGTPAATVWHPATSATKTYKFKATLDAAAPDSVQGKTLTGVTVNWDASSTPVAR